MAKAKPGMLKNLVENSKSAMEYYFHRYIKNIPSDIKLKKKNLRILLSKIKNLPSPIDKNHWLKELGSLVRIDEKILAEEMEMLKDAPILNKISGDPDPAKETESKLSRREMLSQRILGLILHLKNDLKELEEHLSFLPEQYLNIYKKLSNKTGENPQSDLDEIMNVISLRFSFENQNFEPESLQKEIQNLLLELKVEYLREKRMEISNLIRKLESDGDEKSLKEALKEYDALSKELELSKEFKK